MKKLIHWIAHKLRWQHVILVTRGNDMFLKCVKCGKEEYFDSVEEVFHASIQGPKARR